jgi:hypothetical protein
MLKFKTREDLIIEKERNMAIAADQWKSKMAWKLKAERLSRLVKDMEESGDFSDSCAYLLREYRKEVWS